MIRFAFAGIICLVACALPKAWAQGDAVVLVERPWFEARTAHFHTYSCGSTQEVAKLAARLEQFRDAYSLLAGAQAVASPPIIVMAFPDRASLRPFLPLYEGKPASLAAFFSHGADENLISLSLSGTNSASLDSIFHEYSHLLLRHNDHFWPLWLKEGMAEIYSTFELAGTHSIRIGKPLERHLRLLAREPLMPLASLFGVTHESRGYNDREHQGLFYAQSWLLTHYLMLGDNPARKAHFGALTTLLRQGQPPEKAFTNAFGSPLPVIQAELRGYLERGKFNPLELTVKADLSSPRTMSTRGIPAVETCFRLGDQLLRVGQLDAAESLFVKGRELSSRSPLAFEGLGLLAAEREKSEEATRFLAQAIERGSTSFLAHYVYAREKFRLTAKAPDTYSRLDNAKAAEIRGELQKSIALMPDFGPAHHLLGFVEIVQGDNLAAAEAYLQKAVQLEPESQAYLLSLAQAQMARNKTDAARQTLEPLCRPYVETQLRTSAQELLSQITRRKP